LGREEQFKLGQRMLLNYPQIFNRTPDYCLNISATTAIRTQESMKSFLVGLKYNANKSTCIKPIFTAAVTDVSLRFFDLSPDYKRYETHLKSIDIKQLENLVLYHELNKDLLYRFFTKIFINKYLKHSRNISKNFIEDIYKYSLVIPSLSKEIKRIGFTVEDLNFRKFFTCDELAKLFLIHSAKDFLTKGPSINVLGLQIRIAVPLLVDFIKTTDAFILSETKMIKANLRFAHSETLSPFATLIQIEQAYNSVKNIQHYSPYTTWLPSQIIPMSANIAWILYKDIYHPLYLVKILLNEKVVHLHGLTTVVQHSYYNWLDVRQYFIHKLDLLHVHLNHDMHNYLKIEINEEYQHEHFH
ncbi:unnamed protein product, partial [Didymodactylos carnosus]